ncbi:unnamed protein product [Brassica oleracea var. botrytis]|nr:unnamed protein product [Brassica napus]VDD37700.1 unnamed protein product [Brassica oleracea]
MCSLLAANSVCALPCRCDSQRRESMICSGCHLLCRFLSSLLVFGILVIVFLEFTDASGEELLCS